ncbi:deoxyribodipyrimidine photo-lyase [Bowmanella dokdonensis]|uniref:Deoxyribodipyrimidine photo-lyase n=1 Tax=Bowmanella dokdonensis TaxID=751969 RepID=A0A939DLE6_9ALTE|nr:deoxyribodipyrimidine photo-lyase [Bowmanella dokdonensis]MBN7824442.1 deoxyribodipyrimidine photo-lyase [Bowmanella dokdonensis]
MSALVWLRSDLRALWNSPLTYASQHHDKVSALFFITPGQWQEYGLAGIKLDLIVRRLLVLKTELAQRGVHLNLIEVKGHRQVADSLAELCQQHQISRVYFNAEYELDERRRDKEVRRRLGSLGVDVGIFHDTCLVRPDRILNKEGNAYRVFTPYFHQWLDQVQNHLQAVVAPTPVLKSDKLSGAVEENDEGLRRFLSASPDSVWPVGQQQIMENLRSFFVHRVAEYPDRRDIPAEQGTSRLSPYLSIGAVSPLQATNLLLNIHGGRLFETGSAAFAWLRELAWRDFYRYVMYHFPHVCRYHCFLEKYDNFRWYDDQAQFEAWCQGKTGFPIVDAAMRCLNETGWMHNRLRMIVASFLTKHLLLPWRWGEDYFMAHLVDGDFASNNGGWQWSASVGTDAAPYFRIFNPTTQGKKYDAQGNFILAWLPELKAVPLKYLHEPHKWSGFKSLSYPAPIVDHAKAVSRTKAHFQHFLEATK